MDKYAIDGFKDWLIDNTGLAVGSILSYDRTIRKFFQEHDHLTVGNINNFIAKRFREKRTYYVKYAFKYFLQYAGDDDIYNKLVSVKTKPRKSHGTYLPASIIRNIIKGIRHEMYRDIADIQFSVGARACEILSIKEEHIEQIDDSGQPVIRIWIHGKGKQERVIFLNINKKPTLQKYMRGRPGYIFIEVMDLNDEFEINRVLNNHRTYYYNELMKSAKEHGIDKLGTHDHRRNVAEMLRQNGTDMETIKETLGHKSIATTEKYFKNNPEAVREAMLGHQERDM
jgi:integrase